MGSEVRSLSQDASLGFDIERLKNMNPLIRLCGQKRRHRLRDLKSDAGRVAIVFARLLPMWRSVSRIYHGTVTIIAAVLQLPADLRYAREKSATGNLLNVS